MPGPRPHSVPTSVPTPQQEPGVPGTPGPGPQLRPRLQLGHYLLLSPGSWSSSGKGHGHGASAAQGTPNPSSQPCWAPPTSPRVGFGVLRPCPLSSLWNPPPESLFPSWSPNNSRVLPGLPRGFWSLWASLVTRPALGNRGTPGGAGARAGLGVRSPKRAEDTQIHGDTPKCPKSTGTPFRSTGTPGPGTGTPQTGTGTPDPGTGTPPAHLSSHTITGGTQDPPASPQHVPSVPWGGRGGTKRHRGPSTCSAATGPSAGPAPGGDREDRGDIPACVPSPEQPR